MPPPPEERPTTEGTTEDNATATQTTEDPSPDGSPVRAPLHTATFVTAVAAVRPIGHPFLRITFRGGDLHAFRSVGPDQFVYLLLPPPGHDALTIDGKFGWDDYRAMPEAQRPVGAYYTVRAHRPALTEIDIDVLLHDPPGIASIWAVNARPGAPAALWGPRTAYAPPKGTRHQLLLGDETALPAIAAILEALAPDATATVLLALHRDTVIDLPPHPAAKVIRIDHDSTAGPPSALVAAVRARQPAIDGLYVWGGGEFETMAAIRRHLREERGLPAPRVSVVGYWRKTTEA